MKIKKKYLGPTISAQQKFTFTADHWYPWLLFFTSFFIGLFLWEHDLFRASPTGTATDPANYSMTIVLCGCGVSLLIWKGVFAFLYRPFPPVEDQFLPAVSVIIPAYNEGAQVLQSVRSVMASSYPFEKMQVICIDDGSSDDTWHWLQQVAREFPKQVRLIRLPANSGKRHALMAGFSKATGQVHVTIDSDSEISPETLRHLVSPLVRDSRVGAVAGNIRVLNTAEGPIPKMMEVSLVMAFDFIRSSQSVYGGVFCTPGALSAFRAEIIKPYLSIWLDQRFMGVPAAIGEDRALTNIILALGHRVVYQRAAVAHTKMPTTFNDLWRMLLRWERSNVRENLEMLPLLTRRFRPNDNGSCWLRLFTVAQLIKMSIGQTCIVVLLLQLLLAPMQTMVWMLAACIISSIPSALVYQRRHGGLFGWYWGIPASFYWLFALFWIPAWGLITAPCSGWLTRSQPKPIEATAL